MDKDKVKAFADKVFADMAGAVTVGMGYVGALQTAPFEVHFGS